MKEIWKDIPGYEGKYQASNLGNIKSLYGYMFNKKLNKSIILNREKILKYYKNKSGYNYVVLSINGNLKTFTIHRLVALTFISNINNLKEVNHVDGNKLNNNVSNLEWCTRNYNIQHGFNNGLFKNNIFIKNNPNPNKGKFGKENHLSKKINQYDLDGNFIKTFNSISDASRILGISREGIGRTCSGKNKIAGGFIFKFKIGN